MNKKLNESKIEYLDYVFNPITGCSKGCEYCWAQKKFDRFKKDFKPQFHPERLEWPANTKKPGIVGVVFEGDLFGDWVSESHIKLIFGTMMFADQHLFVLLTKNPKRYLEFGFELYRVPNQIHGISASTIGDYRKRTRYLYGNIPNWVSLEPLQGPIILNHPMLNHPPQWIVIGAQTQPLKLPELEWVLDIREQAKELNIPIFEKNNLKSLNLPGGLIQELHPKMQKFREDRCE